MKLKPILLTLGVMILVVVMIQQPQNRLLATKLKMNNYPECPPQSGNINVLLTDNNSPTKSDIVRQIPFGEGTIQYTEQVPNAQGTPVAQVVTYDNYLRGVLAGEVGIAHYFDDEVLKSMAVVARTKAYHHCGTDMQDPQGNGVRGQILQQYSYNHIFNFDETEQTRYQDAVDYGTNPYITHNNDTFDVQYRDRGYLWTEAYDNIHQRIFDPPGAYYPDGTLPDLDLVRTGFMQYNGNMWAQGRMANDTLLPPYDLRRLLGHYYTGIGFEGLPIDPPDEWRFNILKLGIWQSGVLRILDNRLDNPLILNRNTPYAFGVLLQNTGSQSWNLDCNGNQLNVSYHLYSYPHNTYLEPQDTYFDHDSAPLCPSNFNHPPDEIVPNTLVPGEEFPPQENSRGLMYLAVNIDSDVAVGDYWMRFDLVRPNIAWLSGIDLQDNPNNPTWPTQDVHICVEYCSDDNPPPPGGSISPPSKDDDKSTSEGEQAYNTPITIAWQPVEGADEYDYELKEGSGSLSSSEPVGEALVAITYFPDAIGTHVICVRAVKDDERSEETCYEYDIRHLDTQAPAITLNQPNEMLVNSEFALEWSVSDADEWGGGTGVERVELYQAVGNNQWSYITAFIPDEPQSHWITDRTPCQWHKLKLVARDEVGNRGEVEKEVYVRCDQPRLATYYPRITGWMAVDETDTTITLPLLNVGTDTVRRETNDREHFHPTAYDGQFETEANLAIGVWQAPGGIPFAPGVYADQIILTDQNNCTLTVELAVHVGYPVYLPFIYGTGDQLHMEESLLVATCPRQDRLIQTEFRQDCTLSSDGWCRTPITFTRIVTATPPATVTTWYRFTEIATETNQSRQATHWLQYQEPFSYDIEGQHAIHYFSQDDVGNIEPVQTATFKIDLTTPIVEINAERLSRCDTELGYTIRDLVSGLRDVEVVVDGEPVDEDFNLMYLELGNHTIAITGTDYADWVTTFVKHIPLPADVAGIICTKHILYDLGEIYGPGAHGIVNSLNAKLEAAQRAIERGQIHTAINNLEAFINEVNAQQESHIKLAGAERMIADAEAIIAILEAQ